MLIFSSTGRAKVPRQGGVAPSYPPMTVMRSPRRLMPEFVLNANGNLIGLRRNKENLSLDTENEARMNYCCLHVAHCLFYKRNRNCFAVFIQPDANTRRKLGELSSGRVSSGVARGVVKGVVAPGGTFLAGGTFRLERHLGFHVWIAMELPVYKLLLW